MLHSPALQMSHFKFGKKFRKMKNWIFILLFASAFTVLQSCSSDGDGDDDTEVSGFTTLLTNQIDEVIVPTMVNYQNELSSFETTLESVVSPLDGAALSSIRAAHQRAYLAYQAVAVHDYFSTSSLDLVANTNLYPIETETLATLIDTESTNFGSPNHERADGFPAIDFMLYGPSDVVAYFNEDEKRLSFLSALVSDMKATADDLASGWSGLRDNFIAADGTDNSSAISGQLNGSLAYFEFSVREDKVGIPIGRIGPNDSPITPDPTKIEAYYQSLVDGNDAFAVSLVRAAVEEMEDLYLGSTSSGTDGQGYDDLLSSLDQQSVDTDIKAQFAVIYAELDSRTSISEDNNSDLYDAIQGLVTLYKSDMFPVLNVQDADGLVDGD